MCQKESQMEAQRTFKSVPLVLFFSGTSSLCVKEMSWTCVCSLQHNLFFLAPTGFHVRHCLRLCLPCYLRILLPREFCLDGGNPLIDDFGCHRLADVFGKMFFQRTCKKEAGPLRQARVFIFSQISQIALQFCFVQIFRLEMLRCAMCHYAVWLSAAAQHRQRT